MLQPFFRFSYVTMSRAHSPTFPSLHLSHNSFSNPSIALPMSLLILQHFRCFTYVTVHSPTLLSLLLYHKLSYVTMSRAHSPTFQSLHLRHSSLSNPSVALPTSQLIVQPVPLFHLRRSSFSSPSFTSPTSQALHSRHLASRPWSHHNFNTRSRFQMTLTITLHRTSLCSSSFTITTANLWHSLPTNFRDCQTLNTFKIHLHVHCTRN